MMDLMALGFTVVFDDFDFLDLDECDFLDLDDLDFLDLDDLDLWLSPLELREAKERVDPMMESLFCLLKFLV